MITRIASVVATIRQIESVLASLSTADGVDTVLLVKPLKVDDLD